MRTETVYVRQVHPGHSMDEGKIKMITLPAAPWSQEVSHREMRKCQYPDCERPLQRNNQTDFCRAHRDHK